MLSIIKLQFIITMYLIIFCIYFNSLITTSRVFFPVSSSSLNEWAILFYRVSVEYKKILRTDSGL